MNFLQKFKNLIILLLLFAISACGSGCVDPEDYGGYNTEIITVNASGNLSTECNWTQNEDISIDQPLDSFNLNGGISNMLSNGSDNFLESLGCLYYSSNNAISYNGGSFDNNELISCFSEARNICQIREKILPSSASNSWQRTTLKTSNPHGLDLRRDTKIFIKAKGDVSFGATVDPLIAFFGNNYDYQSTIGHTYINKNNILSPSIYDVSTSDKIIFMLSGRINSSSIGSPSNLSDDNWPLEAHLGFSRLYAYVQPFPKNYISSIADSEDERAKGDYPIDHDPRLWECFELSRGKKNFSSNTNIDEVADDDKFTNCYAKNYAKEGFYSNLSNRVIVGGNIQNPDKALISQFSLNQNNIYIEKYYNNPNNIGSEYDITNPRNIAKFGGAILHSQEGEQDGDILSSEVINNNILTIAGSDKYRLIEHSSNCDNNNITLSGSKNNTVLDVRNYYIDSNKVILYPNHSIEFNNANCGVTIKSIKDINIEESGYVRFFKSLASDNECSLKLAISNKDDDYYTHESFEGGSKIKNIYVKRGDSSSDSINDFLGKLSDPIYLRKGQILLFLPDSWQWSGGNCGINTLMHIEHRPAVFCKEIGDYPQGTSHLAANIDNCVHAIEDNVRVCSGNAVRSATIESNYKCFDVTNYKNSLSTLLDNQLNNLDSLPEGVSEVEFFDGVKGNFTGKYNNLSIGNYLKLTNNKDNNDIYKLSNKNPINFNSAGRLKFLFLGDKEYLSPKIESIFFNPDTSNNYDGSNGFEINFTPSFSYSNGQNLQIVLCDDSATNSCNSSGCQDNPINSCSSSQYSKKIIIREGDNYNNGYGFTKSGTLKNIDSSIYKDYYMHNGQNDNSPNANNMSDEDLYLAFNIYNPNQQYAGDNNCFIDNQGQYQSGCNDDASSNVCNGKLIDNPYYNGAYCESGKVELDDGCCNFADISEANGTLSCSTHSVKTTPSPDSVCSQLSPSCRDSKICSGRNFGDSGFYDVTIRVPSDSGPDTIQIISEIMSSIFNFLDGDQVNPGYVENVYVKIVHNDVFIVLVKLLSMLFVVFYTGSYVMGLSDMKQKDLMGMIIKIGVVYLLISPDSWYWYKSFFVDPMKDGINYITFLMASTFDRDPEILSAINNYDFSDKSMLFKSSDRMFKILFEDTIHKKILGIIFNNFFGFIYVVIIYFAILKYLQAFFVSVSFFIIAHALISILLLYGPIFILLIFFKIGESFFKNWYEQLMGLGLQQILIILFLTFFNGIIYELFKMNFNYRVCWGTVFSVPIFGIGSVFEFWSLPSTGVGMSPSDPSLVSGVPHLISIIFIYFMCKMMYDFIDIASRVSATIVGNIQIASSSSALFETARQAAFQTGKSLVGSVSKTTGVGDYLSEKRNSFLDKHFDYGEDADSRHNKQKEAYAADRSQSLALRAAGDKADKKYLKDNKITDTRKLTDNQKIEMKKGRMEALKEKSMEFGMKDVEGEDKERFDKLINSRSTELTDREKYNPLNALRYELIQDGGKNISDSMKALDSASGNIMSSTAQKLPSPARNISSKLPYRKTISRSAAESKYYNNIEGKDSKKEASGTHIEPVLSTAKDNKELDPAIDSTLPAPDSTPDRGGGALDPKERTEWGADDEYQAPKPKPKTNPNF